MFSYTIGCWTDWLVNGWMEGWLDYLVICYNDNYGNFCCAISHWQGLAHPICVLSRPQITSEWHTVYTLHTVFEWLSDGLIDRRFHFQTATTSSWARCLYLAYCVWLRDWLTGVSVSRPWLLQSGDTVYTLHALSEWWTEWFSDGLIYWHFPLQTATTSSWAPCLYVAYCDGLSYGLIDWCFYFQTTTTFSWVHCLCLAYCVWLMDWCFCLQTTTALEWARCLYLAC